MSKQVPWWMLGEEPDTRIRASIRPTILDNTTRCDFCEDNYPSFAVERLQELNACRGCLE